jgi:bis(5'-adenosyl)-triphosphatase
MLYERRLINIFDVPWWNPISNQLNMPDIGNNKNCPFCSPAVQSSVFYMLGDCLALYNIAPVLPGHSLIIPKAHYTSILDLNEHELSEFFKTARAALRILMKVFDTNAFDWSVQEKPEAGQTIEHLHLHIVPRLKGDLKHPGDWYPLVQNNDQVIIDSLNRPRLDLPSLKKIVDVLRQTAHSL